MKKISKIQWLLIFSSIFGVVLIGFDPKISEEILGMILIGCMAFFYAFAQVISRYLKSLDLMFTNSVMGLVGFVTLMLGSIFYEGQTIYNLQNISLDGWLLIFHHGVLCSIMGHTMMFYLYKFYPVGRVLPFYALFPSFWNYFKLCNIWRNTYLINVFRWIGGNNFSVLPPKN